MKNWICAAALSILLALTGCSTSRSPKPDQSSPSGEGREQATMPRSSASKPSEVTKSDQKQKVEKLWRPGNFQYGIQLYWHKGSLKSDEVERRVSDHLDYIISLGANSLGVTFPIYTDGAFPSRVYNGHETPSLHTLRTIVKQAHQRGMRVMLRPLLDEENIMSSDGAWRGTIQPIDTMVWFESYRKTLLPYLRLAKEESVAEFVLATELFSLQSEIAQWNALRTDAEQRFDGRLSYGLNWDGLSNRPPFQQLGLDLYPSIDLGDEASIKEVAAALTTWLYQHPVGLRRRITLQEVGIPAHSGAYREPWLWGSESKDLNLKVQANWFAAACEAAHRSEVQGLYYWMIDSNVDPTRLYPEKSPAGSFMGRPAQESIRTCFTSRKK